MALPGKQRDVTRRIWAVYGPDAELVVREYAAAERRGEVARKWDPNRTSPEDYARALLADARMKGWLPGYHRPPGERIAQTGVQVNILRAE